MFYLYLDTKYSNNPTEPWDCNFSLKHAKLNKANRYYVNLEYCILPNLMYPINQYNNKIYFKEGAGGTIKTATLTKQNYTSDTILTELKTQLEDAGSLTYTITYDEQTGKLNFVSSSSNFQFVDGENNAYDVLGINAATSTSSDYTADYPLNLFGTPYIDLQLNGNHSSYSSDGRTNVFTRIPVNASFGSYIMHENKHSKDIQMTSDDLQQLSLRLRDANANNLVLPENVNVSVVLSFEPVNLNL